MTPQAKAPSPQPRQGQASRLCRHLRALAARVSTLHHVGSGAPTAARRPSLFAALTASVVLSLAAGVAPAFATLEIQPNSGPTCTALGHTSLLPKDVVGYGNPIDYDTVHWDFAYSTTAGGPWTQVPGGSGTVTKKEFEEIREKEEVRESEKERIYSVSVPTHAELTGLTPEVGCYLRFTATDSSGEASQEARCETVPLHPTPSVQEVTNATASKAHVRGTVNPEGVEAHWRFEYAPAEDGHAPAENSSSWSAGPEGSVSRAEAEAYQMELEVLGPLSLEEVPPEVEAELTGLSPSTSYYVRLFAENEPEPGVHKHAFSETFDGSEFGTLGPPTATTFATHAVNGEDLRILGVVQPNSAPTSDEQKLTIGGLPTGGTFALTFAGQRTGGSGTGAITSGSSVLSLPSVATGTGKTVANGSDELTGVTITAGSLHSGQKIIVSGATIVAQATIEEVSGATVTISRQVNYSGTYSFTVYEPVSFTEGEVISGAGIPAGTTIAAFGEATGKVTLSNAVTETNTAVAFTTSLPFDATADTVAHALGLLSSVGGEVLQVRGRPGGPFTVYFGDSALAGKAVPQIEADASGLTPSGTITVVTTQQGGEGYDTHYHFEYVDQHAFEAQGGFAGASTKSTPEVDLGSGETIGDRSVPAPVGADLPGLQAGETYRYRLTATNNTPGDPVVHGIEQSLSVPAAPTPGTEEACPNESLRTGPSANLPDCRAYEQVTPVEKGGAMDAFHFEYKRNDEGVIVGEDGEHLELDAPFTHWGKGPGAGDSPYFFARTQAGWQMTSGSPQPETGLDTYSPELFDADLTQFTLSAEFNSGVEGGASPDIEYKAGPPGGPYATVAVTPRAKAGNEYEVGWAGASEDFSKLILKLEDRAVVPGHRSATKSGFDLYEYSEGLLRQANVTAKGATIGACGARLAKGDEKAAAIESGGKVAESSRHALSPDGSRVFFEADPNANPGACPEQGEYQRGGPNVDLYMREASVGRTVDIGAYHFAAANPQDTELLLERPNGGSREFLLYDVESASVKPLFSVGGDTEKILVSENFAAIYLISIEQLTPEAPAATETTLNIIPENLYRYDIPARTLSFVVQDGDSGKDAGPPFSGLSISTDGRFAYWDGSAAGVPAGGVDPHPEGEEGAAHTPQAFRYDSDGHVIECLSCASAFDPEPTQRSFFYPNGVNDGRAETVDGAPGEPEGSANGDFAFFDTAAALVPADVDGEIEPAPATEGESSDFSPSSDVYEWRKDGIDGCAHPQGCVSLISSGHGGKLVMFLGTAEEGRDVFLSTSSQLVSQDKDGALDIYDARIDGGFPPPSAQPVECEGDACSTPASPPNDSTPSSLTFMGAGNLSSPASGPVKANVKPKPKNKNKKKRKARSKKRGKKATARRSRMTSRGRGAGR